MSAMLRQLELGTRRLLPALFRKFIRSEPSAPVVNVDVRRILIIRQHNQLGDMLCVVPLLRALRRRFVHADIDLLASPGNEQVMRHHRLLSEMVIYDKKQYMGRFGLRTARVLQLARELRDRHYDLVAVPSTVSVSLTSDLLAGLTRARYRFGPGSIDGVPNPGAFLYTHPVDLDWRNTPGRHQTLRNADLLGDVVDPPEDLSHEITLTAAELAEGKEIARGYRAGKDLVVVIHPGAGKPQNRWPAGSFAELARGLSAEFDVSIVVSIGPMDHEVYQALTFMLDRHVYFSIDSPVRELASTLTYADLVISNDTGIMHVAASVGSPVLSLFGPTNPLQWAPIGPNSRYIHGDPIETIPVQAVMLAATGMLRERLAAQKA